MNHFSLEVIAKEKQHTLLDEQMREQKVYGRHRKLRLPARLVLIASVAILTYFWLFL